jgi:hypothetical protein
MLITQNEEANKLEFAGIVVNPHDRLCYVPIML